VALGKDGTTFSWGRGPYGVLGHGSEDDEPCARPIGALKGERVQSVAAGPYISAALTADGKVLRFRDEMDDWPPLDTEEIVAERKKLLTGNRGCGNGVFIEHEGGWTSIYCHIKKGSVSVKAGDEVKTGDKIGEAGQSGFSEFPHLHFGVYRDQKTYDPFTGMTDEDGCGAFSQSFWDKKSGLSYVPVSIYAAGFRTAAPDIDAIKIDASSPSRIPLRPEALVFWSAFYGMKQGDEIDIEVRDPSGAVYAQEHITQEKDRARQFYYVGRNMKGKQLIPGIYEGFVKVTRTGADGERVTERFSKQVLAE
jgi:hypothetical protein